MKNKFRFSLVVFLIVVLGCFTSIFAENNNDGAEIGTANLGTTTENSANVGDTLYHPEKGWKRYDDTDTRILYGSENTLCNTPDFSNAYNGTIHQELNDISNDSKVKFSFIGTKFRIIMGLDRSGISSVSSKNVSITLDGKIVGNVTATNSTNKYLWQVLTFEKQNLIYGKHTVILNNEDKLSYMFDAVDIDDTSFLIQLAKGVTLNKTTDELLTNQNDTLTATITPTNTENKSIAWTSSDESIATVDKTGKITALKEGQVKITAATQDGSDLSASCVVTVKDPTAINLNKTTDSLTVGDTDTLTAKVTPDDIASNGVSWSSSDESTVKIVNGTLTAVKAGIATITATTADGKTATCTVTVKAKTETRAVLTLNMVSGASEKYDLSLDELNNFVKWYDARSKGTADAYYTFTVQAASPYTYETHTVAFDKIVSYIIQEYTK